MKARITGIITVLLNIAFVAFLVDASAAHAQGAEAVGVAVKASDKLLELGPLGIFCVILILANDLQFYGSYIERKEHKAELKERNDLLAKWAAQISKATADSTAATVSATASNNAATAALTAVARAVERLDRMEITASHPVGGRK